MLPLFQIQVWSGDSLLPVSTPAPWSKAVPLWCALRNAWDVPTDCVLVRVS